jgi:hypothetical protein
MKSERPHLVPLTPLARAQLPFRPVSNVILSNCIARHTDTPERRLTSESSPGDESRLFG